MNRALKIIAIAVLVAMLGGVYFIYKNKSNDRRAELERIIASQKEYEDKINAIDDELEEYKAGMTVNRETGDFVVAFNCATPADVDYVLRLCEARKIAPAFVVNCNADDESLTALAGAIVPKSVDVLLMSSPLSMDNVTKVETLFRQPVNTFEYDPATGAEITIAPKAKISGIFFLTSDDQNADNIKFISGNYIGYTMYTEHVSEGIDANGMIYMEYSANESGIYSIDNTRYIEAVSSRRALIISFKANGVIEGTPRDSEIKASLDSIGAAVADGRMRFATINEAAEDIRSLAEKIKAETAEYEAFAAEKEKEKSALEEQIKEIAK